MYFDHVTLSLHSYVVTLSNSSKQDIIIYVICPYQTTTTTNIWCRVFHFVTSQTTQDMLSGILSGISKGVGWAVAEGCELPHESPTPIGNFKSE